MSNKKYEKFQLDGVEYKTTFTQKWINRKKWVEPDPNLLYAHIPGTILHIEAKEGDSIQEDQLLMTLQSMKMNNQITAPFAAKIKKIHVTKGDRIPKGTLMIELE